MPRSTRIAGVSVTSSSSFSTATLAALTSGRSAIVTVTGMSPCRALDHERHLIAHAQIEQLRLPVEGIANRAAARAHEHVAATNPRAVGRRARHHRADDHAGPQRLARIRPALRNLRLETDPRTPHRSVREQIFRHVLHTIHRNRESEPDRAATRREDRAVHPRRSLRAHSRAGRRCCRG